MSVRERERERKRETVFTVRAGCGPKHLSNPQAHQKWDYMCVYCGAGNTVWDYMCVYAGVGHTVPVFL